MGVRAYDDVGRLALERARVRMPELAPASVQVVELVRGAIFVVVRTPPACVVVLDERGRLVRGRPMLTRIAHHVRAVERVSAVLADAQVTRRVDQANRSRALLAEVLGSVDDPALRGSIGAVLEALDVFERRLDVLAAEQGSAAPPTERTLRRTVSCLQEAARADRDVVRKTRGLALAARDGTPGARATPLQRWLLARLASSDLPFFFEEIGEREDARFVTEFVAAARCS